MRRYDRISLYVPGGEDVTETCRRAIQEALNNPDVAIEFTHNGGTVTCIDNEFVKLLLERWDRSRKDPEREEAHRRVDEEYGYDR